MTASAHIVGKQKARNGYPVFPSIVTEIELCIVSRKPPYKDVCRRAIEILQRAHIFKANCYLKVHNAHIKLASPIFGVRLRNFTFDY